MDLNADIGDDDEDADFVEKVRLVFSDLLVTSLTYSTFHAPFLLLIRHITPLFNTYSTFHAPFPLLGKGVDLNADIGDDDDADFVAKVDILGQFAPDMRI